MSELIDHATGKPVVSKQQVAYAIAGAGVVATISSNKDAIAAAAKVAVKAMAFLAKNPKVGLGIVAIGAVTYGVHRLTKKGTKIKVSSEGFDYERK